MSTPYLVHPAWAIVLASHAPDLHLGDIVYANTWEEAMSIAKDRLEDNIRDDMSNHDDKDVDAMVAAMEEQFSQVTGPRNFEVSLSTSDLEVDTDVVFNDTYDWVVTVSEVQV